MNRGGDLVSWSESMKRTLSAYSRIRRGEGYRLRLVTGVAKEPSGNGNEVIYDSNCQWCTGRYDWRISRRIMWPAGAAEHMVWHVALPFMLVLRERYPEVYEEVMMAGGGKMRVVNDDEIEVKGFPVGNAKSRLTDVVNLMDELLLVRDLSLRIYEEIVSSGEMKYYGTAMMAVKEIRSVAETMGKFSLIAKQLEKEGEVERLPAPLLELVKEVAGSGVTYKEQIEEELKGNDEEIERVIVQQGHRGL